MSNVIDFALEGSSKAALAKAFDALSNQLGYALRKADGSPNTGVCVVVNVPPGANTNGIPPGFSLRGPFVHKPGTYDENGDELTAPVMASSWYVDVRLTAPASDLDRDNDGVNEVTKSKLKRWLVESSTSVQRSSSNDEHPGTVTYYEKVLAGGDWVRLYPTIVFPKHVFAGSTGKEA